MSLTTTEGLTIEDLEAMPDDGRRYELIGGSIVVNAVPAPRHQWASAVLNDLLRRACPDGHRVYYAPVGLDLPGGQRVEPDLVVVPHASIGAERLSLPVLLVVELVSPSTAVWDQVAKREAYAAAGIEHYWLIDARRGQERFTALRLGHDGYDEVVDSTERIDVDAPVPVSAPIEELFEAPG
jgi:Uma2 family endonuclease